MCYRVRDGGGIMCLHTVQVVFLRSTLAGLLAVGLCLTWLLGGLGAAVATLVTLSV